MVPTETAFKLEGEKSDEPDELKNEIRRDLLALDLRISLFIGAAESFKYNSLLKPVPAAFRNEHGEVAIDEIRRLINKIPEVTSYWVEKLDEEVSSFLKTIVLNNHQILSSISFSEFKSQINGQIQLQILPRWIFSIEHTRNQAWENRKAGSSTFYAYHGSRFENFHSILNLGLHQHLNKTSLFGEGIYLSVEQSLSIQYSPCGQGWSKSRLGPELSLLAICEVIDHPDVKRKGSRPKTSSHTIPDKYILVTNNELVRPRYLLVYTRPKATTIQVSSFLGRHKFLLFLGLYVSLLMAIGVANKGFV